MSNSTSPHLGVVSVRSEPEPIDPNEVPLWVSEKAVGHYFQVTTVTLLVYDALITLDKETKYFWVALPFVSHHDFKSTIMLAMEGPSKSGGLCLFSGDVYGVNITLCNFAEWTRSIANWVTIISIDYILMLRVLALYSQDTRLSVCLTLFLILEAVTKLSLMIYGSVIQHIAVVGLSKDVTVCGSDNNPPWQLGMVDWLIPMTYGAILMVFALCKAAEYWRMSAGFKGFMLVKILIRNQVLYFMLVIACCTFNIVEFKVQLSNGLLSNILIALGSPAFLTILGSRMLFNLKEAGERGQNEGTSYRVPSRTISDIDFAEPAPPQRESGTEIDEDDGQA